jgi:hypothetical protein
MVRNEDDPPALQTVIYLGHGDHFGMAEHESAAMNINYYQRTG